MWDGARTIYSYPGEHGPSGESEFGKTSPRKLLERQPPSRYIQSRLLRGQPRWNKPPAVGWSTPVCRRHLHMRVFGKPKRTGQKKQQKKWKKQKKTGETGHDRVRVRRAHQSSACLCEFITYFGSFLWLNLKKGRIE